MRMNARVVALGAGVFFVSLAIFVQGLLPFLHPESRTTEVTQVVRTDLGELKWMHADATDYTELEQLGRQVYIREGCWYCHSQFVRPVTGETRRWGPVSQAGEYAFDVPHLFSTRRIGPDLTRVGLKYSDEWHLAHFWDPRMLVPDSIMPRFVGLFDVPGQRVAIVDDDAGNRTLERNEVTEAIFDFDKKGTAAEHRRLTPNAEGLLFVPERGKYPVIFTPNDEYTGETVQLAVMTPELEGRDRLSAEAGHEPGQVARPVRAAAAGGVRVRHPALRGVDRPRQGGLRAALRGLPRRRRATATARRRRSCTSSARATSSWPCSSSASSRARCRPMAT